jgi:hypothetical protein
MTVGVALNIAEGAGMVAAGATVAGGSGASFFLQPATAIKLQSRTTGTRIRLRAFNVVLLPKTQKVLSARCGVWFLAAAVANSVMPMVTV